MVQVWDSCDRGGDDRLYLDDGLTTKSQPSRRLQCPRVTGVVHTARANQNESRAWGLVIKALTHQCLHPLGGNRRARLNAVVQRDAIL